MNLLLGSHPVLRRIELHESLSLTLKDLHFDLCPNLEKVVLKQQTLVLKENSEVFPPPIIVNEVSFHAKENLNDATWNNVDSSIIHSMDFFNPFHRSSAEVDQLLGTFDFKVQKHQQTTKKQH